MKQDNKSTPKIEKSIEERVYERFNINECEVAKIDESLRNVLNGDSVLHYGDIVKFTEQLVKKDLNRIIDEMKVKYNERGYPKYRIIKNWFEREFKKRVSE